MTMRRVLIIEDDVDSSTALQLLIKKWGFECRASYDGVGGLLLASEFHPHVIVLDLMLPFKDGWDLAGRFRNMPATYNSVIIVTTGLTGEEERIRAWESGVDYCLTKPVDFEKLRLLVKDGVRTAPLFGLASQQ